MAGMPGRGGGWNRKVNMVRDSAGRIRYRDRCVCGREKALAATHCFHCYQQWRPLKSKSCRCSECGKQINDKSLNRSRRLRRNSTAKVFCSPQCRGISLRFRKTYRCEMCDVEFFKKKDCKRRFCGNHCYGMAIKLGLSTFQGIPLAERVRLVGWWADIHRLRKLLGMPRKVKDRRVA